MSESRLAAARGVPDAAAQNGASGDLVAATLQIRRLGVCIIDVPIVGTAPLIVHRFSEKAKQQMLSAMRGEHAPKTVKDPSSEYEASFYRCGDGTPGMPVIAFKAATVSASRFFGKDVSMVILRQSLFMTGEIGSDGLAMARIDGIPHMREDVVRVGRGGTDLRYRPEFTQWRTVIRTTYVPSILSEESVLSLIDAGGMGVGVGEWRPERAGTFGTYEIDSAREVERIR